MASPAVSKTFKPPPNSSWVIDKASTPQHNTQISRSTASATHPTPPTTHPTPPENHPTPPTTSTMPPATSTMPINLARALRIRMQTSPPPLTIAMADDAYDYNLLGDESDPDDLYDEMLKYNQVLAESLQSTNHSEIIDDFLLTLLSKTIFGSNHIERAGSNLAITLRLCRAIFLGSAIPSEITSQDHPDHLAIKADLVQQGLPAALPDILRRYREIVQHARAASYILTETCLKENNLTEAIILETHRILTHKVDTEDGYPWTSYSGVYRTVPVGAGLHMFPAPERVPTGMRQLIASLDKDVREAAGKGEVDPVGLAAKYSYKFVALHPFVDGNGRTCRLVLNALLIKYGVVLPACIGMDDGVREKYLEIAATASLREALEEGCWDAEEEQAPKYFKGLATYTLKFVTEELRGLVGALEEGEEKGE